MRKVVLFFSMFFASVLTQAQSDSTKLSGNLGIGIGNIRDHLSPHIEAVGLLNSWEESELFQYGLWMRTTYSYPDNDKSINTFLSAVIFLSNEKITKGFGFGYALKRQGGIFNKNTFLISYHFRGIGSGFYLSPELILSGGFSEFIPSLRVGVLF